MPLLSASERSFAASVAKLAYANPFLPERKQYERAALGPEFIDTQAVWSVRSQLDEQNPNVQRLAARVEALVNELHERLGNMRGSVSDDDRRLYEDLVLYWLYHRHENVWWELILTPAKQDEPVAGYEAFRTALERLLAPVGQDCDPAHLFACFFQVRRAFHYIFRHIVGGSMPMARLRAAAWQSIFTHDMRRYRRALYDRIGDVTTLVVGPSGTGKEVVARAIAVSRYIPFDPRTRRFKDSTSRLFHPINLSALAPTLLESELFGHRRGAFTGAVQDRVGWLEQCSPHGAVFLDEIGDVDSGIQVKLLRVLQSRTFERLGDTQSRPFRGKIIAATNRDLPEEIRAGRFRQDFYYRLCADIVRTPTLREQLQESAGELHDLVHFIAQRVVGDAEAEQVAGEVTAWIEANLGRNYPWAGNVRELEQCVRNVLVRGEYQPLELRPPDARTTFVQALDAGTLTADQLLTRYCTLVYTQTRSYQETARRLGLDRRTVRSKVVLGEVETLRS